MLKNIANFNNTNDYLPLFNAVLITDLFVIFLLNVKIIKSNVLRKWYYQYNLSAVIADVLILVIGIIITQFIYPYLFSSYSLGLFIIIAVIVQICHDLSFAYLFNMVPRGKSRILDTFKDYAKEKGLNILLADALMIISTVLIATYLSTLSTNSNIITLILDVYCIPYLLYSIPL